MAAHESGDLAPQGLGFRVLNLGFRLNPTGAAPALEGGEVPDNAAAVCTGAGALCAPPHLPQHHAADGPLQKATLLFSLLCLHATPFLLQCCPNSLSGMNVGVWRTS